MTNEELCIRAQGGDRDAWNSLLLEVFPFIEKRAAYFSSKYRVLRIDEEDMAHDFVVLYDDVVKEYKPEKGALFLTYFSSAIRNLVSDKADPRKRKDVPPWKETGLNKLVSEKDYYLTYDIPYTPEDIYLRKETIMEVREALERVSIREQAYLHYRFGFLDGEEHAQNETAEHFYLSLSRGRSLERSAIRHVRKELKTKQVCVPKKKEQVMREPGKLIHEDFWIIHN